MQEPDEIRLFFIGDSFVNGAGDEEMLGWAGRLASRACKPERDVTYYNLGVRGHTSTDILHRWENETRLRLKDGVENILVFSFGVNDTVFLDGQRRVAPESTLENARHILSGASEYGKLLMVGPPPIDDAVQNERIEALDVQLADLCQDQSVPYLSVFEALLKQPLWLEEVSRNDGAHPRAGGYTLWMDLIKNWPEWPL